MKKLSLLIIAVFTLVGCNQGLNTPTEDVNTYTDEEFNVSFSYPSNWEIDAQDRFVNSVGIFTGDNQEYIFIDYKIDLEEFEKMLGVGTGEGGVSVKESSIAGYPATEYRMHGGIKYIIEFSGNFVMIDSEFELTQEQEEGIKEILNSLSF